MTDTLIVSHRPQIAAEILEAHAAAHSAVQSGLDHARRAGQLLAEVKATITHGAWLPWIAEHLPGISERTVQNYMTIATRWSEIEKRNAVADLPLRDALRLLAEPLARKANPADVDAQPVDQQLERQKQWLNSRHKVDRKNRGMCRAVMDLEHFAEGIDAAFIAGLDTDMRPVWAAEIRQHVRAILKVADLLAPKVRP